MPPPPCSCAVPRACLPSIILLSVARCCRYFRPSCFKFLQLSTFSSSPTPPASVACIMLASTPLSAFPLAWRRVPRAPFEGGLAVLRRLGCHQDLPACYFCSWATTLTRHSLRTMTRERFASREACAAPTHRAPDGWRRARVPLPCSRREGARPVPLPAQPPALGSLARDRELLGGRGCGCAPFWPLQAGPGGLAWCDARRLALRLAQRSVPASWVSSRSPCRAVLARESEVPEPRLCEKMRFRSPN